jgi:glutathionyl-hydroquinone reductase
MSTAAFPTESDERGAFVRQQSRFRERLGTDVFPYEAGRYHLYVSLACPWAHRAVIVRRLKRLEEAVGVTVVDPIRDERGWRFGPEFPDPLHGWSHLSEAYPEDFQGRVTVPTLWDTATGRIVNNESADIIENLNAWPGADGPDLWPEAVREEGDALNRRIYDTVNNGVYKSGFATTQEAYEAAVVPLFQTLEELDARLAGRRYLLGDAPTLADWRLFTTLVRFDAVYVGHFKCNIKRIVDLPHLSRYLGDLLAVPGVRETVDLDHIKRHYYVTHRSINPTGIVPVGPALDWAW